MEEEEDAEEQAETEAEAQAEADEECVSGSQEVSPVQAVQSIPYQLSGFFLI